MSLSLQVYKYKCDIVHMNNSTSETIVVGSFGILDMLKSSNDNFDEISHYLNTSLTQLQPCSAATQREKLPLHKRLNLNFEFDYEIDIVSMTPKKDLTLTNDAFDHQFEIRNVKRSPSNEPKKFIILVPDLVEETQIFGFEDQAECHENLEKGRIQAMNGASSKVADSLLQITCETHQCKQFDCTLNPGLIPKEPVKVTIRMTLDPNQIILNIRNVERFDVVTKIKIDDEEVASKSRFNRNSVGGSKAIWEWWPMIVGAAIASVLFGACIYGLKKSGILQKMRIYDNKEVPSQEISVQIDESSITYNDTVARQW